MSTPTPLPSPSPPPHLLAQLADNELIVYIAYFTYLLPWTILPSVPFITAHWKPLRGTIHDGILQLTVVTVPIPYIIFYILDQNDARDYKEMFAAVVGLLLSLFHITRTVAALWQLHAFRRWAADAIDSLQRLGFRFVLNPVFVTASCCRGAGCPRCPPSHPTPADLADRLFINDSLVSSHVWRGYSAVFVAYRGTKLRMPRTSSHVHFFSRITARLKIFFAHIGVICHWLYSEVRRLAARCVRRDIEIHRPHLMPHEPAELFMRWGAALLAQGLPNPPPAPKRKAPTLAHQLLTTATLHLHAVPSKHLAGLQTHQTLLDTALTTGIGLPYSTCLRMGDGNPLDGIPVGRGFDPYARKLAYFVEDLPAGFGEICIGVAELEWLAIVLFLGAVTRGGAHVTERTPRREKRESRRGRRRRRRRRGNDQRVIAGNVFGDFEFTRSVGSDGSGDDTTAPMQTLCAQLGVQEDDVVSTFPGAGISGGGMVCGKVAALRTSAIVDTHASLHAGETLARCMHPENAASTVMRAVQKVDDAPPGCNDLGELYSELMGALLGEMRDGWEQVVFLGVGMECVRSALAYFREDRVGEVLDWTPPVTSDLWFPASTGLEDVLRCDEWEREEVHVRLVWEVQMMLMRELGDEGGGPDGMAQMLALLSWPALSVTVERSPPVSTATRRRHQEYGKILANFNVTGLCAPQPFSLNVRIWKGTDNVRVGLALCAEEDSFVWRSWRDAFLGMLRGGQQWREATMIGRKVESDEGMMGVIETDGSMADQGWIPFRQCLVL